VADDQNPLIIFFTAGVVKKIDLLFFKKNEKIEMNTPCREVAIGAGTKEKV